MTTAIDLFAGCGGTTRGLKDAGFNVLAAVEINEKPIKVFQTNFKDTKVIQADLFIYSPKELMRDTGLQPGDLHLLAGCPPCQSFSSMRTRNGSIIPNDKRSDLVSRFCDFVIEMKPKSFAFENVSGLYERGELNRVLNRLEDAGYNTDVDILNAINFGVPQRRKRVFAIGSNIGTVKLVKDTFERKNVEDAIKHLGKAGKSGDYAHDLPERRTDRIKELISYIPKNGGSRSSLPERLALDCHKRNPAGFRDVYGRMAWSKPSPTITGGCASPSKGRFLHPTEDRCITMREAAILQGFPDDFIFPNTVSKTDLAQMIGNALPPPMLEHQARSLKATVS